jgi:hypothetical protein
VPEVNNTLNDSGNAAIWAAHLLYDDIVVVGADAWLGGESRTVCDELYPVAAKKSKLGPIWLRRFLDWSGQTQMRVTFVRAEPHDLVPTLTLAQLDAKYQCGA